MNKQKWIILFVALGLIGAAAGLLSRLKANQRLGQPGIFTKDIPHSPRKEILLPELVLDYTSEAVELDTNLFLYMPQDSSFVQRRYKAADGFQTLLNVVLMGSDRSTIHKPQFCLKGQGWTIDDEKSIETTVPMQRPQHYDLPVMKLLTRRQFMKDGKPFTYHGIYVYWFVDDHQLTASHGARMWSMAGELLRTGVLERWAYITCFAVCEPGQEEATYARMQKFIQASVPQFQKVPGPLSVGTAVTQAASK
ncbi:MAG: eight transrane protein EpsH [Pedosphaera sp.]|nr:eight transrane protein EpsH [Pedosphaera sp.]